MRVELVDRNEHDQQKQRIKRRRCDEKKSRQHRLRQEQFHTNASSLHAGTSDNTLGNSATK